ncbi:TetR/AcrR family transcriptional regulator [Flavisphingomonas formosensis]|uniref:TetR/AcrR family transcriptional regulator n=1 Tax=Flavisphingomonas formosensis TaxID=861534 RepID=UPI0012FABF32|nr:TetR/AcrR family transcriptional regulator [Sphingomonas formosensis]
MSQSELDGEAGLQAAKSRRTRDRILSSTIALIKEGGFSAASSKRIADRAGMTWGAAQHHFGSKDDILRAVIETSHQKFVARFADIPVDGLAIEDRIALLVDRMWGHYQDDIYLAAVEIVMASRDLDRAAARRDLIDRPGIDHLAMMQRIFPELAAEAEGLLDTLIFAHCLLTGLAIQKTVEGPMTRTDRYLAFCKEEMGAIMARMLLDE